MGQDNQGWQKVRRQHRAARFLPVIRIRRNGQIAISSDFARMADISACTHATLFIDARCQKLGLSFHNDESDDDAFSLCKDGGSNDAMDVHHRVINCKALLAQSPSLASLLRESARARQYEPKRDADGLWVVHLAPCFEHLWSPSSLTVVGRAASGIYRYMLGEEVVYIGRGVFAERFAVKTRADWEFDRIEYSVLNDDALERRWESFWLNDFRQSHNRWPLYNRVAGITAETGAA